MRLQLLGLALFATICLHAKKDREVIGCQPIYEDRVFMSATEVTNFNYHEFLFNLKEAGEDITPFLPDTTVWITKGAYNDPYVEYYFRHPAYRDYPVVGVTKEQAEAFCSWLSEVLTEKYQKDEKSDIDSVVVRLPNKQEWINAAKGGNDYYEYPWKGHSLRMGEGKFQGMMRANFVRGIGDYMGMAGSLNDNADVTAPVVSYWPNDFGLYNCAGNVAEMVGDEDVAMGGGWRSLGYDIKVTSEKRVDSAYADVGFRYLVEVVRLKPSKENSIRIDKKFVKKNLVQMDSVIMFKYEVSNGLYNLFLKETKHPVQDTTIWNDQFIYSNWYKCNYRWHAVYQNYPAVGMTRTDVEAFCIWMTGKLQPHYDFTIRVDLPTEEEWEKFARGGLELSPYPWGGPYLRNAKGCLLANHRYVPEAFSSRKPSGEWTTIYPKGKHEMFAADLDGALACAAIDTYNPNGYGLYNISGNVREMIKDSEEYTKGGGWNSIDYYLQISGREAIEKEVSPDIGFRFVVRME